MLRGITVYLRRHHQTGADPFGRPIYKDDLIAVDNVLVGEPTSDDVISEINLSGKHITYTLAIPKSDTNEWENTEVIIYGEAFRTIGKPMQGIDELIPLAWNKKVRVERYE